MSPLFEIIPFFAIFAACLGLTVRRLWVGDLYVLPSFGWLMLTCLPYCLEFPFFSPQTRIIHGIAICILLAVILACDFNTRRLRELCPMPVTPQTEGDHARMLLYFGYGLAVFFMALSGLHLYFADNIPYLELLHHGQNDSQIITDRINFSRSYSGIPGMKYLYSFSVFIFAIPAFLMLVKCKQWPAAAVLFVWAALYSISSTAKGPLITLLIVMLIGMLAILGPIMRMRMMRAMVIGGFAGFLLLLAIDLSGDGPTTFKDLRHKYALAQTDKSPDLMMGDYIRQVPRESYEAGTSKIVRMADYYIYRIVLTPVEVSARWYEYFAKFPVIQKQLSRNILDSRTNKEIHPSNAVGRWAYYERYPAHYTPDVYAYSSIDADAFGRFGWIGLIVAAGIYAFMRIWLAFFDDADGITVGIFGAVSMGLLTVLPTSASIQAILLAQGLGFVMGLLLLLKLWGLLRHRPE